MIFRSLSKVDGDWNFGNGRSSFAKGNDAIMFLIETTVKTFLGECFFNKAVGLDWFTLINLKDKNIVMLNIKYAIAECYGVINVNNIEYSLDVNRELVIIYDITTIYTRNVIGTVTL